MVEVGAGVHQRDRHPRPARDRPRRGGVQVGVGHGGRSEHGRAGVVEPPLEGEERIGGEPPRLVGLRPGHAGVVAQRGQRLCALARGRAHELDAGQRERADQADAGVGPDLRAGVAGHVRPDDDVALGGGGRGGGPERDRDAEPGGAAEPHAGTVSRHQSSTQRLRRPSSCQSTGKNASSSSSSPGRR